MTHLATIPNTVGGHLALPASPSRCAAWGAA
jgi:hypothetical protein